MAASRARANQAGQAAVLAALCLFSMVVFLAMATNMGSLVNERIRMQNAADLAAYSGARVQAQKLNDIAMLNKVIQDVATYCRARLTQTGQTGPFEGREWNKIWDQCMPEQGIVPPPPALPIPPVLAATGPLHDITAPPNADSPALAPNAGRKYGANNECQSEYDTRATDLIAWCERTIQYYAQIIYDINDYGAAYYGTPTTTDHSSLLRPWPILKAVQKTAQANYPRANVEMLDAPENSPVYPGRFRQKMVVSEPVYEAPGISVPNVPDYNRPGGPAMMPLNRYLMRFNYVYRCCSNREEDRCGPAKCGISSDRHIVLPNVGPVPPAEDGVPARYAYVEFDTIFFKEAKGTLFMPVRMWGNPREHDVPFLDLPGRTSNYFGGSNPPAWNDLRATAVAKPFEGLIGPSWFTMERQYGVNEEVPVAKILFPRALSGVYVPGPLVEMRDDGYHGQQTYRARMAGFREYLEDGTSDKMLDVLHEHVRRSPLAGDEAEHYWHTAH